MSDLDEFLGKIKDDTLHRHTDKRPLKYLSNYPMISNGKLGDLMQPHNSGQDHVFIQGLQVEAIIGVYEWEQAITQPLIFDIVMSASQHTAAKTDNIKDAINYKIACERIAQLCQTQKVALLETLAERVAQMLLTEFTIEQVQVCIHKPTAIKNAASVGVNIIRLAAASRPSD